MKKIKKDSFIKLSKIFLAALFVLVLIYSLIYAPYKMVKITEANQKLNQEILEATKNTMLLINQNWVLNESKDLKRCELLSGQQLQLILQENKDMSEEEQRNVLTESFRNCLIFEGREYLIQQQNQDQNQEQGQASAEQGVNE